MKTLHLIFTQEQFATGFNYDRVLTIFGRELNLGDVVNLRNFLTEEINRVQAGYDNTIHSLPPIEIIKSTSSKLQHMD